MLVCTILWQENRSLAVIDFWLIIYLSLFLLISPNHDTEIPNEIINVAFASHIDWFLAVVHFQLKSDIFQREYNWTGEKRYFFCLLLVIYLVSSSLKNMIWIFNRQINQNLWRTQQQQHQQICWKRICFQKKKVEKKLRPRIFFLSYAM